MGLVDEEGAAPTGGDARKHGADGSRRRRAGAGDDRAGGGEPATKGRGGHGDDLAGELMKKAEELIKMGLHTADMESTNTRTESTTDCTSPYTLIHGLPMARRTHS